MSTPYYDADGITLYLGDCREVTAWLEADVLVTDPPYGIGWKRGVKQGRGDAGHAGIENDHDTTTRDEALALWGDRPALIFGSFWAPPPANVRQTLVYRKPPDSGVVGSTTGWRRDVEPVYVTGPWPKRVAHRSSLFVTSVAGAGNLASRFGHPHTKPGDVLCELIRDVPPGAIADPFAGSGSTLVAARACGRSAVGVELSEAYCEVIASRLAQGDLFGGAA